MIARQTTLLVLSILVTRQVLGQTIPVYFTKAFPLNNPSETYRFYDVLPFCPPAELKSPWLLSLTRILDGERLLAGPFPLYLNRDVPSTVLCTRTLTAQQQRRLQEVAQQNYVAEIEVDSNLSAFVKLASPSSDTQMVKSLDFVVGVNKGEVVSVDVTATYQPIAETVDFTHSVQFVMSSVPPKQAQELQKQRQMELLGLRMDGLSDTAPRSVHWLGVANAFVLTMLILSLMTAVIIRSVRADLASQSSFAKDEEAVGMQEDDQSVVAWKLLHGDVFRAPVHRMVLASALGAGLQLLMIVGFILVLGVCEIVDNDAVPAVAIVFYLLSSFIAGMESSKWYVRMNGQKWAWCVVMTALFFAGPVFVTFAILNTLALTYHSTAAFPFAAIFWIFAVWAFVTLPLTIFGAVAGQKLGRVPFFPCKTNKIPREVPRRRWYERKWIVFGVTSFLAFSAIYVELHFLVTRVWTVGVGNVMFSALLMTSVLLSLILAAAAVLFTYFSLATENHKWQWRAYFAGASFSMWFMTYSTLFFLRSQMSGFLQASFFFLYSALAAYALALILGYISFAASLNFVVFIFSRTKVD